MNTHVAQVPRTHNAQCSIHCVYRVDSCLFFSHLGVAVVVEKVFVLSIHQCNRLNQVRGRGGGGRGGEEEEEGAMRRVGRETIGWECVGLCICVGVVCMCILIYLQG